MAELKKKNKNFVTKQQIDADNCFSTPLQYNTVHEIFNVTPNPMFYIITRNLYKFAKSAIVGYR